ncbi:MAG TPA: FmdB family zinc ribbon protein [Dehalococcoidia bacterium]|jgi:putative FmdB family regulatory protein
MPIYEYGCTACGAAFSRLRPLSAAAEDSICAACGAAARRTVSSFAVAGRAAPPAEAAAPATPVAPLCQRYPHLPLLCHMEPKAAERWVARAEGREEQYLEREAKREQARALAGLPAAPPPAPAEQHFGHVHGSSVPAQQ